jgi:amino acid transporter
MPQSDSVYYYVVYAIIAVVFIVVLKMPKSKTKEKKRPISTSKKFQNKQDYNS